MRRRTFWLVLAGLLTLLTPLTARAADPPSPVTLASFRTEGIPVDGPFEVYQNYSRSVPTACLPVHTHSGQVVITVLTGALDRIGAGAQSGTYTAGQSWVESAASPPHQACNNGAVEATAMATYLLPKGAPISNPVPGQQSTVPVPTIVAQFRTEGIPVAGPFEVYQSYSQFVPTACLPVHTHSGQVVVTVLTGALDRIGAGAQSGTYTAGQSWVESAASPPHQACNNGPVEATAMATYLLPKGAPISNPVTQTAAGPSAGSTPSAPQMDGGGEAGFIRRLGDG
jgi:quercetin dioxygenase-like cupin family protein